MTALGVGHDSGDGIRDCLGVGSVFKVTFRSHGFESCPGCRLGVGDELLCGSLCFGVAEVVIVRFDVGDSRVILLLERVELSHNGVVSGLVVGLALVLYAAFLHVFVDGGFDGSHGSHNLVVIRSKGIVLVSGFNGALKGADLLVNIHRAYSLGGERILLVDVVYGGSELLLELLDGEGCALVSQLTGRQRHRYVLCTENTAIFFRNLDVFQLQNYILTVKSVSSGKIHLHNVTGVA